MPKEPNEVRCSEYTEGGSVTPQIKLTSAKKLAVWFYRGDRTMTNFAIIRTKKHKSLQAITGIAKHHSREIPCPTADVNLTSKNHGWGAASTSKMVGEKVQQIISDAQKNAPRKFRDDSVKAIEYLMTASPDFWKTASKEDRSSFIKRSRSWLEKKHGAGCVVAEWLHVDEHSPHIHAIVIPLVDGVLNAKHFLGGKARMRALQDDFAKQVGEPVGLLRGLKGSDVTHTPAADWWAALNAPTPQPSRVDFAKAAVGINVPSIDLAYQQAQALNAIQSESLKTKKRIKAVDQRERKLAVEESFLGDKMKLSQRVSELERENETLKNKVRSLETPKPGTYVPGQSVGIR